MTKEREEFVTHVILGLWVQQGFTESEIALKWNSGQHKRCSSGVNRFGVKFDSCAYQAKVLAQLR